MRKAKIACFWTSSFQVFWIDGFLSKKWALSIFIRFSADLQPDEKLPVMFWIHGGYFFDWSGNDNLFGPDFLIEQRVILVTLNYRLGIFGFLSLGTREYSGNMGLKDQQLALKWVHENIDQFSGDKKRITIFGESAGINETFLANDNFCSKINFKNVSIIFWQVAHRHICKCYPKSLESISIMQL